jgi:hypothetical protein
MKHYSSADLADFANGMVSPRRQTELERHLMEGCKECGRELETWQRVREVAQGESGFEPPPSALKVVKGSFALYGPRKGQRRIFGVAHLIYDSLRQPSPAGVRSADTTVQKLLYCQGNLQIDLNVESLAGGRISIDGQILDSDKPADGLGEIPVVAYSGKARLAETRTNVFGEFHLECEPRKKLRLSLRAARDSRVTIALDEIINKDRQRK